MSSANPPFSLEQQPEVFASEAASSVAVHRAVRRGEARRITRGLYTRNVEEPIASVVRRGASCARRPHRRAAGHARCRVVDSGGPRRSARTSVRRSSSQALWSIAVRAAGRALLSASRAARLVPCPVVHRGLFLELDRRHRVRPRRGRGDRLPAGHPPTVASWTLTALIRVLDVAQRYSASIPWQDLRAAEQALRDTNAFVTPDEANETGIRLQLPRPLV